MPLPRILPPFSFISWWQIHVSKNTVLYADFFDVAFRTGPLPTTVPPDSEPLEYPGVPIPGYIRGDVMTTVAAGNRGLARYRVIENPALPYRRYLSIPHDVGTRTPALKLVSRRITPTERRGFLEGYFEVVALDEMPAETIFIWADPFESFNPEHPWQQPEGLVQVKFQNGQVSARTNPGTAFRQVGSFQVGEQVPIRVRLNLATSTNLTVKAGNATPSAFRVRFPNGYQRGDYAGMLALHVYPPYSETPPARPQELRLLSASVWKR